MQSRHRRVADQYRSPESRNLPEMDNESLIASVYKQRAVWDKRDKTHYNRNVIERCWKEICAELNEDEFKLKKKWKYLRDQFCVEIGKSTAGAVSGDNIAISKWPYLRSLMFLKDVVKPRSTTNPSKMNHNEEYQDEHFKYESDEISPQDLEPTVILHEDEAPELELGESHPEPDNHPSPAHSYKRGTKRMRLAKYSLQESLLEMEKVKLECIREEERTRRDREGVDEDLLFFKSLLSHVRKIHGSQKLTFRNHVSEIVQQYAYQNYAANQCDELR